MTFSGFPFLLGFLPFTLAGFAIVSRFGQASAKTWLIAASLLFYAAAAPQFLPLLLLSVGMNLLILHIVYRSACAGQWVALGVVSNLAVLAWFKCVGAVPLGLSFFTFTQIGCLLYHAAGDTAPPKARDYALFAAFFPTLIAGPILNPGEMLPQFARINGWRLTPDNMAVGIGFFLIGLLQKTLLADPLSSMVAAGFADPSGLTLLPAWQAACGYSLQLYFDFSGYTDMAIGLGCMLGLRLPDNFDQPYRAMSVIAYWQRWHMSLTRFLMTHVHAPLTMAILRHRRTRKLGIDRSAQQTPAGFLTMIALPVGITMTLVSLWHGFSLNFLIFGALHIGFLLVNHAWRLFSGRLPSSRLSSGQGMPVVVSVALTYLCVLVAAVFFRATSITDAASLLVGMAGLHGVGSITLGGQGAVDALWIAGLYAIVWGLPSTRQLMQPDRCTGLAWRASPGWAVGMGCAATLGLLAAGGTGEFLYFRF